MPGRLLARPACFPTALGAVGEEFDTGRGAVEQMLARGVPAPPLCLSPFFSSLSSALLPAYFPFRLCPFTSSLRLLSVCFPRRFCRPVFLSSPLSALLSVFLSTFACIPFPFRLRRPPFSLRSVGTPCLCPPAFSFRLCRLPFSMRSVRLSFPLPLPVRFSFPPLSPAVFYAFWQSAFLPISLRLVFPSPLAVWLSPRFRPPFFPFAAVCPPAFSFSCHPPFSIFCPSAFLRRFSLPVCLFGLSAPAIHRSLCLFPSPLSAQFSSLPLPPAISLTFSLSIFSSAPAARPSLYPSFPHSCPPTRREGGEAP